MCIVHTEEVRIFIKVTVVEKNLIQHIISKVEEADIMDTCNCTTNSINNAVENVFTHLQEN